MGLLFSKRTRKQKVIDKIYNSFYVKENIIENFKIGENLFDCVVICSYGLFIFRILANKNEIFRRENNFYTSDDRDLEIDLGNPFIKLENDKKILLDLIKERKLPIYLELLIGKNKNIQLVEEYGIRSFRTKINKYQKCVENIEIDELFKFIKCNSCHIIDE